MSTACGPLRLRKRTGAQEARPNVNSPVLLQAIRPAHSIQLCMSCFYTLHSIKMRRKALYRKLRLRTSRMAGNPGILESRSSPAIPGTYWIAFSVLYRMICTYNVFATKSGPVSSSFRTSRKPLLSCTKYSARSGTCSVFVPPPMVVTSYNVVVSRILLEKT